MREDIFGGLKNALERGEPLEKAIQSFINSGYNDIEVRQAAKVLTSGVLSDLSPPESIHQFEQVPKSSQPSTQGKPQQNSLSAQIPRASPGQQYRPLVGKPLRTQQYAPREGMGKIILLVAVLLILMGALALTILFRESLVNFFTGLL